MLPSASTEQDLIPALKEIWEKTEDEGQFSDEQQQMMIRNILDRYPNSSLPDENDVVPTMAPVHRVHFIRKWWAVAASIVFIAGIGAYLWFQNKKENSPAGPMTTLGSVRKVSELTFQFFAAAVSSIARVFAPSSRYCRNECAIEPDPPTI